MSIRNRMLNYRNKFNSVPSVTSVVNTHRVDKHSKLQNQKIMNSNIFQYSLRVWLTSVVGASLVYMFITTIKEPNLSQSFWPAIGTFLSDWLFFAGFQLLFSLATWLVFYIFILLIVRRVHNHRTRLWTISIAGILLTIITFKLAVLQDGLFNNNSSFAYLMIANCFFIGAGSWFYELRPPEYLNWA